MSNQQKPGSPSFIRYLLKLLSSRFLKIINSHADFLFFFCSTVTSDDNRPQHRRRQSHTGITSLLRCVTGFLP